MSNNNVDLHAFSLDPLSEPKVNKPFRLKLVMRNNGPGVIPKGEAVAMVNLDNRFITVPRKIEFYSPHWKGLKVYRKSNYVTLSFQTITDMAVNQQDEIIFMLKGKKKTGMEPTKITAFATLNFNATTGDANGFNNQVDTEFIIK